MITDRYDLWRIIGNVSTLQVIVTCDRSLPEGAIHLRDIYDTVTLEVPDVEKLIVLLRDAVAEQEHFVARMKDAGISPWVQVAESPGG